MKMINIKIISILVMTSFLMSNFAFAAEINQTNLPMMPGSIGEAKTIGLKILEGLPQALKGPWREALGVWGKMADIFSGWWNAYISPRLKSSWQKIKAPLLKEIERRKPIVKEEFKKQEQEMKGEIKTEVSGAGKSLWERLKELF